MTPTDIIVRDKGRILALRFAGGEAIDLAAEYLRVESPSAEVQGHNPSQKKILAGKRDVAITGAEPVGNYAIRLIFSDGHSSGIFSWDALRRMAADYETVWATYLKSLSERGLSRDQA